jgi:hypothetical protein
MVEEAGVAVGGGHDEEGSVAGSGEEGADGEVERVGDPAGFVDDEEADFAEAADVVALAGKGDDARGVGELEGVAVCAVRAQGVAGEPRGEVADFAQEFGGLALGGGEQNSFRSRGVDGMVEGAEGGGGGFAPLAAAVDEDAGMGGVEDLGLERVGDEAQVLFGPECGRRCGVCFGWWLGADLRGPGLDFSKVLHTEDSLPDVEARSGRVGGGMAA